MTALTPYALSMIELLFDLNTVSRSTFNHLSYTREDGITLQSQTGAVRPIATYILRALHCCCVSNTGNLILTRPRTLAHKAVQDYTHHDSPALQRTLREDPLFSAVYGELDMLAGKRGLKRKVSFANPLRLRELMEFQALHGLKHGAHFLMVEVGPGNTVADIGFRLSHTRLSMPVWEHLPTSPKEPVYTQNYLGHPYITVKPDATTPEDIRSGPDNEWMLQRQMYDQIQNTEGYDEIIPYIRRRTLDISRFNHLKTQLERRTPGLPLTLPRTLVFTATVH